MSDNNNGPSKEDLWKLASQSGPIKREDIGLTNKDNTTSGLSALQEGVNQLSHELYE